MQNEREDYQAMRIKSLRILNAIHLLDESSGNLFKRKQCLEILHSVIDEEIDNLSELSIIDNEQFLPDYLKAMKQCKQFLQIPDWANINDCSSLLSELNIKFQNSIQILVKNATNLRKEYLSFLNLFESSSVVDQKDLDFDKCTILLKVLKDLCTAVNNYTIDSDWELFQKIQHELTWHLQYVLPALFIEFTHVNYYKFKQIHNEFTFTLTETSLYFINVELTDNCTKCLENYSEQKETIISFLALLKKCLRDLNTNNDSQKVKEEIDKDETHSIILKLPNYDSQLLREKFSECLWEVSSTLSASGDGQYFPGICMIEACLASLDDKEEINKKFIKCFRNLIKNLKCFLHDKTKLSAEFCSLIKFQIQLFIHNASTYFAHADSMLAEYHQIQADPDIRLDLDKSKHSEIEKILDDITGHLCVIRDTNYEEEHSEILNECFNISTRLYDMLESCEEELYTEGGMVTQLKLILEEFSAIKSELMTDKSAEDLDVCKIKLTGILHQIGSLNQRERFGHFTCSKFQNDHSHLISEEAGNSVSPHLIYSAAESVHMRNVDLKGLKNGTVIIVAYKNILHNSLAKILQEDLDLIHNGCIIMWNLQAMLDICVKYCQVNLSHLQATFIQVMFPDPMIEKIAANLPCHNYPMIYLYSTQIGNRYWFSYRLPTTFLSLQEKSEMRFNSLGIDRENETRKNIETDRIERNLPLTAHTAFQYTQHSFILLLEYELRKLSLERPTAQYSGKVYRGEYLEEKVLFNFLNILDQKAPIICSMNHHYISTSSNHRVANQFLGLAQPTDENSNNLVKVFHEIEVIRFNEWKEDTICKTYLDEYLIPIHLALDIAEFSDFSREKEILIICPYTAVLEITKEKNFYKIYSMVFPIHLTVVPPKDVHEKEVDDFYTLMTMTLLKHAASYYRERLKIQQSEACISSIKSLLQNRERQFKNFKQ